VPPQRQRRPVDAVTLHNCRQTTLHHARRRPMGIGTRSLHVRGGAVLIAGLIVTPLPTPPGELGLALAMRGQSSAFFALQSAPTREKMGNRRNLRGIATLQQGTRPRRPIIPFFPQFPRSSLQETLAAGTRYIHYPAQTFAPARRRGIHNASTTPCKQEAVTAPAREGTDDTPPSNLPGRRRPPSLFPRPPPSGSHVRTADAKHPPQFSFHGGRLTPGRSIGCWTIRATLELMNGASGYGNSAPSSTRI
jgi:hypothetical protein